MRLLTTPSLWLYLVLALFLTACPADPEATVPDAGLDDVDDEQDVIDDVDEGNDLPDHRSADCDPLLEGYCSMPWPSNLYLERDESRATGYTLDFGPTTLPSSNSSHSGHIAPEMFRRLDGYGFGTPVIVLFPGVDISQMPSENAIEDSIEDDNRQAFYFKVTEGGLEPVPFWAELDLWTDNPEEQVLYLRPAVILEENTRYVVGFRNLANDDGVPFERSAAFENYITGEAAEVEELAWRQERFDEIFDLLDDAGFDRQELTLAWDFHTGSSDGLHSTLLQIIEDGVAAADQEGIEVVITNIEETPDHAHRALEIRGTFRVPHFLERSYRSGAEVSYLFHRDEDGRPTINDWREAPFWLIVPHSALDGTPHGLVKYGHGMLGRGNQVGSGSNPQIANENNLIFFGADFIGFSQFDVPHALFALQQPTFFEELVDRMHQGVLEYVLLTRAMEQNLENHPQLEEYDIVVDHERIYYSGISQGGIYGTTLLAVDPTITRGHLGVPGLNYAMLMERSSNFGPYFQTLRGGYPERIDQSMVIPIIQLMWDQIDPISYMAYLNHHPFDPNTPKHGLYATAKADYQVAVVTMEIAARSGIGIPLLENYDREREPWGVDWATYPHQGSGVVNYDFSNPWPEPGNLAPDDEYGDPHGQPRRLEDHSAQMVHFFETGEIIDVCDGEPCYYPRAPVGE